MAQKDIGYIGLGKMGHNMVARLAERGWRVVAYDPDDHARQAVEVSGAEVAKSIHELVGVLTPPRLMWIMVPHTAVERVLGELVPFLAAGDTVIDGGNTPYGDSISRAKELQTRGIDFLDVGVSGGPEGARNGACLMVGGEQPTFKVCEPLFQDLATSQGYRYVGTSGAGHYVKMVHNGIEYGMMQAIAEGFGLMRASKFKLNLTDIAELFCHGSVIESRLIGHLTDGFRIFGEELTDISGTVGASGEGSWTVAEAEKQGLRVPAIRAALDFRADSHHNPSYIGKILSMLRNRFGGHAAGQTIDKK
jgi:6-phosphogluconate dehydrogenase